MSTRAVAQGALALLALASTVPLVLETARAEPAEATAHALVERAEVLAGQGRCPEATPLLEEAMRIGKGTPAAQTADLLLAMCAGASAAVPEAAPPATQPAPATQPTPAADPGAPLEPSVPMTAFDPYIAAPTPDPPVALRQRGRRGVAIVSGGAAIVGAQLGLAYAAHRDLERSGSATIGGAGAGLALGLLASWDRRPDPGPAAAAVSVLQWSVIGGALTGWVAADASEDDEDDHAEEAAAGRGSIAGGAVGAVVSLVTLSRVRPTEGTVVAIDALGLGGCAAGFLVAGVIAPPRDGAYALQCGLGAAAGLALGVWVAPGWDARPKRIAQVMLGSATGAAASLLVYPLIRDEDSRTDERAIAGLAVAGMLTGGVYAWLWTIDPEADAAHAASESATFRPGLTIVSGVRGAVPGLMISGSLP